MIIPFSFGSPRFGHWELCQVGSWVILTQLHYLLSTSLFSSTTSCSRLSCIFPAPVLDSTISLWKPGIFSCRIGIRNSYMSAGYEVSISGLQPCAAFRSLFQLFVGFSVYVFSCLFFWGLLSDFQIRVLDLKEVKSSWLRLSELLQWIYIYWAFMWNSLSL